MPRAFPSAADIEASTPPDRDRAIDVIRIVSLVAITAWPATTPTSDPLRMTSMVGVVAGPAVMATSTIVDGVFMWGNLLTTSVVFQALTWVFQIMPLFFFAGVAASV